MNRLAFLLLAILTAAMLSAAEALPTDSLAALDHDIAQPRPHPRLFFLEGGPAAMRERVAADPILAQAGKLVVAHAETLLGAPPVERIQEGRRLLAVSRLCLERVTHLAMAYHLTGERRFAGRAEKEMRRGGVHRLEPEPFPRCGGDDRGAGHRLRLAARGAYTRGPG